MSALVEEVTEAPAYRDVYERLRSLARRERRRFPAGSTLNTTALVHELWIDLSESDGNALPPRDFFAYAATAMRNLLVDRARRAVRPKHGGDLKRIDLDGEDGVSFGSGANLDGVLELDHALRRLLGADARAAQVVEMHYFAGLELAEVAELLQVSKRTVNRDWRFARAYLHDALAR